LWPARIMPAWPVLLISLALTTAPAAAGPVPVDPVRVGLIAGQAPWPASLAAGAQEAADRINREGGVDGRPLVLTRLATARPWHDGASRISRLAATPGTVALLGAVDGGEAHLAAQVASRLRLPLVTVSPEESLTQAGSVWVFRAIADDHEQARSLLARIPGGTAGRHATLVIPGGREGRERQAAVGRAWRESGMGQLTILTVPPALPPAPARDEILLLWLDAGPARLLLESWSERRPAGLLLGSTRLNHPAFLHGLDRNNLMLPGGADDLSRRLGRDLVNMLARALADAGEGSHALRAALAATPSFSGETGIMMFDRLGNRREADPASALFAER